MIRIQKNHTHKNTKTRDRSASSLAARQGGVKAIINIKPQRPSAATLDIINRNTLDKHVGDKHETEPKLKAEAAVDIAET